MINHEFQIPSEGIRMLRKELIDHGDAPCMEEQHVGGEEMRTSKRGGHIGKRRLLECDVRAR